MGQPALSGLYRCEVRWKRTTGVASDDQTNTFFVGTDTGSSADLLNSCISMATDMRNFLDNLMPLALFDPTILAEVLIFDMLDAEPRIPVGTFTLSSASLSTSQPLPEEVTAVISYYAEPVSGQSMRQRRGRMYLPTFTVDALDATSSTIWDSTTVGIIHDLGIAMKGAAEFYDCALTVFSRVAAAAAGGSLLDQARAGASYVLAGWVDNEPDTQRRRGRPGGTKTAWS